MLIPVASSTEPAELDLNDCFAEILHTPSSVAGPRKCPRNRSRRPTSAAKAAGSIVGEEDITGRRVAEVSRYLTKHLRERAWTLVRVPKETLVPRTAQTAAIAELAYKASTARQAPGRSAARTARNPLRLQSHFECSGRGVIEPLRTGRSALSTSNSGTRLSIADRLARQATSTARPSTFPASK